MVELKYKPPLEFLEEEERNGYIITRDRKELWAVEIDLLCELDRVCKELHINYYLDSGSLLGAIRDHGFIPWDDDIDVVMLREDYNQLIKNGISQFFDPYFLQTAYNDKNYFRAHAQLRNSNTTAIIPKEKGKVQFNQGVFIDIFVLDGLTDDIMKLKRQLDKQRRIKKLYRMIWLPTLSAKNIMIKKCISNIIRLFCHDSVCLYRILDRTMQKYTDSQYIDKVGFRNSIQKYHKLKKEWYSETKYVNFEWIKVPVPYKYDEVLCELYGNNYLLPKKAPTLHGQLIINTDLAYNEYLLQHQSD